MSIATFICNIDDLIANTGTCALINRTQVALFRVVNASGENFYAISNYDPFSAANVLSRGIVGSTDNKVFVASPIYKQRFDLETGGCLDDPDVKLHTWPVHCQDGKVFIESAARMAAA